MIKYNICTRLLPWYLRQQNSYLKQVKIISFFNYGYIKLWAKFNTYASKKKYFYNSHVHKFYFYHVNSFKKIKNKKLKTQKHKFFVIKRKKLGLLSLYRSFKPNLQVRSYNYYNNYYSSVVIFKDRNKFFRKKYKYWRKIFLYNIFNSYFLVTGSKELLKKRKNKYLKKLNFSTKSFSTKKHIIAGLLGKNKKKKYLIKNIKFLTSYSKQLLMLQNKNSFYRILNRNIFNYYIWRSFQLKYFLFKRQQLRARGYHKLNIIKKQFVQLIGKFLKKVLSGKSKKKQISRAEKRYKLLKKKIRIHQVSKKNNQIQKSQKSFFYNNRKFYYYYLYYTKFNKVNGKITKKSFNKLSFLYDCSKLCINVENKGKLLSLYQYMLYKQNFLLNKYIENLYANFYFYPSSDSNSVNLYQLALLNNNKNSIKYVLNTLFGSIKNDFNSNKFLYYRNCFPFNN